MTVIFRGVGYFGRLPDENCEIIQSPLKECDSVLWHPYGEEKWYDHIYDTRKGHYFDEASLREWFKQPRSQAQTCPTCRASARIAPTLKELFHSSWATFQQVPRAGYEMYRTAQHGFRQLFRFSNYATLAARWARLGNLSGMEGLYEFVLPTALLISGGIGAALFSAKSDFSYIGLPMKIYFLLPYVYTAARSALEYQIFKSPNLRSVRRFQRWTLSHTFEKRLGYILAMNGLGAATGGFLLNPLVGVVNGIALGTFTVHCLSFYFKPVYF